MDLNTILIILGIVALIALVAHGLWANRREKSQYFENANVFTADSRQTPPTTEPVSVVSHQTAHREQTHNHSEQTEQSAPHTINSAQHIYEQAYSQPVASETQAEYQTEPQSVEQIKIRLPEENRQTEKPAPVYQMRPDEHRQSSVQQQTQDITSFTIADIETNVDEEEGINTSVEQLRVQLQEAAQTPTFSQSPLSPVPLQQPLESHPQVEETETEEETTEEPQEPTFIMLYVVAAENSRFQGSELSQALEDLGFIFSKGSIYHRHLDLSVASPILFSAANINQPGTFDLYRLTEFYTVGIALFMQLPSEGNDRANLKMMIRAAKTLAEQLNGFVLTEQQELFTEQAEQEYLARVK